MASLRDIRRRINSVKNTRKITRAMKLVAGAKMRKAQEAAQSAQPYQQAIGSVINRVAGLADGVEHPLLQEPNNSTDVLIIGLSSDRGLCGGFNAQVAKLMRSEAARLQAEGKNVSAITYGKKVAILAKHIKGLEIIDKRSGITPTDFGSVAVALREELTEMMLENKFSTAVLCYNEFQSVMTQEPILKQVLPPQLEAAEAEKDDGDYLFEPAPADILGSLLPKSLETQLLQAFLDTEAGEQAARMQAMDNATRNAGELIDRLSLQYNRASSCNYYRAYRDYLWCRSTLIPRTLITYRILE